MSILVRHAPQSLTREQYDRVNAAMRQKTPGEPPRALSSIPCSVPRAPDFPIHELWGSSFSA
jgi:hypothetical protein